MLIIQSQKAGYKNFQFIESDRLQYFKFVSKKL